MSNLISEYHLIASRPYQPDDWLYSGTEVGLKEFIQTHKGVKPYYTASRQKGEYPTVAGYFLWDLNVMISGPEVREYLE